MPIVELENFLMLLFSSVDHKPDHAGLEVLGPHLLTWSNLTPVWLSNNFHCKVWDEITYPLPNFKSAAIEVWS